MYGGGKSDCLGKRDEDRKS